MRNKHDSPGSRRRFLGGVLGGSLGAGLIGLAGDAAAQSAPAACLLTPALTEGPFYTDQALMRSDIRDGRPGQLLRLRLVVVDSDRGCAPVAGALASIWHCDAGGSYSGYDQAGMPPPPGARGGRIPPSAGGAGPGREEGGMHAAPTSAARFPAGRATYRSRWQRAVPDDLPRLVRAARGAYPSENSCRQGGGADLPDVL
ncbi:hypothetical protein ACU4GD_18760 [Cupriavidus basilensis]